MLRPRKLIVAGGTRAKLDGLHAAMVAALAGVMGALKAEASALLEIKGQVGKMALKAWGKAKGALPHPTPRAASSFREPAQDVVYSFGPQPSDNQGAG